VSTCPSPLAYGSSAEYISIGSAIEYYDITFNLTSGFDEKNTVGFYTNVKFNECVLDDAKFQYCTFVNVTFDKCNFKKTLFANVYLNDVHFTRCDFIGNT